MGIIERKERGRIEMKRQILDAARTLFLEQGFEKTSIRNIADVIEYSPATIYLYFKDKDDLLLDLHNEAFGKFMIYLQSMSFLADPFERLVQMGRGYINFGLENPELYHLMFLMISPIETLECRDQVWQHGHTSLDGLKAIIRECIAKNIFHLQDVEGLSMMIWAAVHGLVTLHLTKRTLMFPEEERLQRTWAGFENLVETLKRI
jgi:AcrR family transcriptional regulator